MGNTFSDEAAAAPRLLDVGGASAEATPPEAAKYVGRYSIALSPAVLFMRHNTGEGTYVAIMLDEHVDPPLDDLHCPHISLVRELPLPSFKEYFSLKHYLCAFLVPRPCTLDLVPSSIPSLLSVSEDSEAFALSRLLQAEIRRFAGACTSEGTNYVDYIHVMLTAERARRHSPRAGDRPPSGFSSRYACWHCGMDHLVADCPTKSNTTWESCWHCGGSHLARDCPQA